MPSSPATSPCQYRAGRPLRKLIGAGGELGVIKEGVHIRSGKRYTCKVYNKELTEGREPIIRNELDVLKCVSSGHPNIVTLYDYFETRTNLYLCFDQCTGGDLCDILDDEDFYHEPDAVPLVRTIMNAVEYIHDCGIVHRNLKPEKFLFRTPAEDADIMISDFSMSQFTGGKPLTQMSGTPAYMAPEIYKRMGHGKPVDIWAMGVTTYLLLSGMKPFRSKDGQSEREAIVTGSYEFEPPERWADVSETARDFISACLTVDPAQRPTAADLLKHPWLADDGAQFACDPGTPTVGHTSVTAHPTTSEGGGAP
ncbi:kinase-like domain-containing protein [Russula brevipes]|nr:kinase-like domain-containing protein [Russula brevipes]